MSAPFRFVRGHPGHDPPQPFDGLLVLRVRAVGDPQESFARLPESRPRDDEDIRLGEQSLRERDRARGDPREVDEGVHRALRGHHRQRELPLDRLQHDAALPRDVRTDRIEPARIREGFESDVLGFYTALGHFARRLDEAGVGGLVLFNRFYQPEIDIEELQVRRALHLSRSSELPLRQRWLAILSGRVKASLAVSGGVHTVADVIQSVMTGAHAVQIVSALLQRGPHHLALLRQELTKWLEEHEYDSLRQMQGSMNLESCPDPRAYERANYMLMLQGWRAGD